MGTIDVEEQAHRLANAIIKDIILYNQAKLDSGQPLAGEIDEGRKLFYSRVRPEFRVIFESALASSALAGRGPPLPVAPTFTYEHPPLIREEPAPKSNAVFLVLLAVAVVLILLAMVVWGVGFGIFASNTPPT